MDNIARIEDKIDKTAAGATSINMSLGGVQFQSMIELMEFSKLMAVSGPAVPVHLRGNPGACLAVCTRALRFGFDPFSLAEHSYSMKKKGQNAAGQWEDIETIAYDSFVIHAIIEAHARLTGRLRITFDGEGEDRTCTVSGIPRGEKEPLILKSPSIGALKKARGRNDKGQIRGSQLWDGPKSDQQLSYDTRRDFCRRFFPEVLLGWYDKEELEDYAASTAHDVTPDKPDVATRLKGGKTGRGFSATGVEKALTHTPGDTLEIPPAKEPVPVAAATSVGEPIAAQLDLAEDVENEVANKRRAVENAEALDDLKHIAAGVTDYLKRNKRTDLLADFLSAVSAREKKLAHP